MKRTLLFSVIAILTSQIFAQSPVVTSAIATGLTGKTIHAHFVSTPAFSEGNSGAAQTWDFSTYSFPAASTTSYVTPSTAYGYSSMSNCTDALQATSGPTTTVSFARVTSSVYSTVGISQQTTQGNIIIVYDNNQDVYHFPMSLNNTFTDAFHGTANYGSGVTLGRGGSVTTLVDGYGTLKTPAGTFANCLRLKSTQTILDTFYYAGQYTSDQSTLTVSYNWVAEAYPGLTLMNISTVTTDISTSSSAFYVETNTATGIEEIVAEQLQFSVYPNPTKDVVNIDLENNLNDVTVSISDITGKQVLEHHANASNNITLSTSTLAKGMYIVKVTSESAVASKRLVIE